MKIAPIDFSQVYSWPNLYSAWRKAAKGKRSKLSVAAFEYKVADELLKLQYEIKEGEYQPGAYTHFYIHEPKKRLISAAPFRDRVVHHALCNIIEPEFERRFIGDSYANRPGRGTHCAIDRLQQYARNYRYVLRMDIVKHFPSIDHQILYSSLSKVVKDENALHLIRKVIASGDGISEQEYGVQLFPGDDLLAACRPRGLPIGNLTSQFWSNCYLHPLDLFIKRHMGCKAYLRYVDDFAMFSNSKKELWSWKQSVIAFLYTLRLRVHESAAQAMPVACGIPLLGFVVFPNQRRIKARKVHHARHRLLNRFEAWQNGNISFAEFDASVQGWINHVRYADTWQLRERILSPLVWNGSIGR